MSNAPQATIRVWKDGTKFCALGKIKIGENYWYVAAATDTCEIAKQLIQLIDSQQGDQVGFMDFISDAVKSVASTITHPDRIVKAAVHSVKDVANFVAHPDQIPNKVGKFVRDGVDAIAKSDVIRTVAKGLKEIADNPYIAGAINIAAVAIPGAQPALGAAYLAYKAAYKVADGIYKGDPTAIANAAQLASGAMAGIPGAKEATNFIATAMTSPQGLKDAMLKVGPQALTDLSAQIPGAQSLLSQIPPGLLQQAPSILQNPAQLQALAQAQLKATLAQKLPAFMPNGVPIPGGLSLDTLKGLSPDQIKNLPIKIPGINA